MTIGSSGRLIAQLDAFRKKRNISDYERAGNVSQQEAREMLGLAEQLRSDLMAWLKRERPSLSTFGQ